VWDKTPPPPRLPADVIAKTAAVRCERIVKIENQCFVQGGNACRERGAYGFKAVRQEGRKAGRAGEVHVLSAFSRNVGGYSIISSDNQFFALFQISSNLEIMVH
jgi:hypothetical protein